MNMKISATTVDIWIYSVRVKRGRSAPRVVERGGKAQPRRLSEMTDGGDRVRRYFQTSADLTTATASIFRHGAHLWLRQEYSFLRFRIIDKTQKSIFFVIIVKLLILVDFDMASDTIINYIS